MKRTRKISFHPTKSNLEKENNIYMLIQLSNANTVRNIAEELKRILNAEKCEHKKKIRKTIFRDLSSSHTDIY